MEERVNTHKNMLVIINYNMGNINSISNMIKKIGYNYKISSSIEEINKADKLILPGVGAFDRGMANLKELNLIDIIKEKVLIKSTPILGICLGMQLMTNKSEEGESSGLGFVNADTKKFQLEDFYKVPHMGWNTIKIMKESSIFNCMNDQENRFYFVHSYFTYCKNESDILCTTEYGGLFTSAFEHMNIIGTQFHPEKSHKFGMQLLKNYMEQY